MTVRTARRTSYLALMVFLCVYLAALAITLAPRGWLHSNRDRGLHVLLRP